MVKMWLIAKSNMKKKKVNMWILVFMVAMATLMFYVGISVLKNLSNFLDDNYEKQNGAHVAMAISNVDKTELEEVIRSGTGFDYMEQEEALVSRATCNVAKKNSDSNSDNMMIVFLNMDEQRTISDFTIHDKGKEKKKNSIVVPMYLKVGKGYETGDEITITINKQVHTFEIYGFVEDVMFASPSNVTIYKCFVTEEYFNAQKENSGLVQKDWYNIRLDDVKQSSEFEEYLCKEIGKMEGPAQILIVVNYELMRGGTSMFVTIIMSIFTVFSVLFVVIALIVMRHNLVANLEENISNIGILQAVGYTSNQLAGASIMEYLIVGVAGILLGFAMTYPANTLMTQIISGSMGLTWHSRVDILVGLLTVLFLLGVIFNVIFVTTRKFKKISTLSALRDGIETHNFKSNFITFQKSVLGLNMTIGCKNILQNKKQSISLMVIVMMLSFISVTMLFVYSNFVGDASFLIQLVGIEKPEISIGLTDENLSQIRKEVENDADVTKVLSVSYGNVTLCDGDKEKTVQTNIYSDVSKRKVKTTIRGKAPEQKNEIAITNKLAYEFNVDVGDIVTLKVNDKTVDYLVVGITQQISYMGIMIDMNEMAYQQLVPEHSAKELFIYLKNGVSVSEKIASWETQYKDDDIAITNYEDTYDTILGTYTASLNAICKVFAIITVFVVSLILILLVRMKMIRERRNMGVYKALGYTTLQLLGQMLMSFIPVVGVGSLLGCVAAVYGVNPVFAMMLSVCGIEKCNLVASPLILLGAFAVIMVVSVLVVTICSLGIRTLEAYKMITEQ